VVGKALVVTTINDPRASLLHVLERHPDWQLVVVGDRKTPSSWELHGSRYLSLDRQRSFAPELARSIPLDHYARKNLGYLWAMASGASTIAETDDDNEPTSSFLTNVENPIRGRRLEEKGWINVYRLFTDDRIWPRGFPLDEVQPSFDRHYEVSAVGSFDCPIQQHLANGDPDVDAIYRLLHPPGTTFGDGSVALGERSYCPFNSQNTIWWPSAYVLLYLPCFATFRMTDIWRSFVAQVCTHACGRYVAFRFPTVDQVRNVHSLMNDFIDEIPGYVNNRRIMDVLCGLELSAELSDMGANLVRCYEALADEGLLPRDELRLVELWLDAVAKATTGNF
jgi:hypothetical protein